MVKVQPPIVQPFAVGRRLGFNHPPTAVGGIQEELAFWCRLGFNHPPTAVGGIRPRFFTLKLALMGHGPGRGIPAPTLMVVFIFQMPLGLSQWSFTIWRPGWPEESAPGKIKVRNSCVPSPSASNRAMGAGAHCP